MEPGDTMKTEETDSAHSCSSGNIENSSTCILDTDITYEENRQTDENPGSQDDTRKDVKSSVSEDSTETCLDVRTNKEQNFLKNTDTLTSSDSHTKAYNPQGARPKTHGTSKPSAGQKNASHLSNKKRKELAKQVKKKNRDERRKLTTEEGVMDCASEAATASVMPDLGALAI